MGVLKVIELVGIATDSWETAARAALADAARSVRGIEHLEVVGWQAVVRAGEIVEYQARVRLTFRVETGDEPRQAVAAAETILAEPSHQPDGEPGESLAAPSVERPISGS
jgi:flavin-binding protein dodecin